MFVLCSYHLDNPDIDGRIVLVNGGSRRLENIYRVEEDGVNSGNDLENE